jgi:hypothetical protein
MTTPAVNQNLIQTVSLIEDWRYGNGSVGSWNIPIKIRRSHDQRPASTSNPFISGFEELRACGDYSRFITRGTYSGGTARMDWRGSILPGTLVYWGFNGTFWGDTILEGPPPFESVGWHHANSIVRAKEQLADSPVSIGLMLAEVRETSELVGGAAETIARQVANFRRNRRRAWQQLIRAQRPSDIPGHWLQLQYGWKPLMSDVSGACEALSLDVNNRNPVEVVRGESSSRETSVRTVGGGPSAYIGDACKLDVVTDRKVGARTVLMYKLRDPLLATFSSLGLVNPASIVWETLKYSFVVDWFLPIGDWLNSFSADAGWDFITGSTTDYVTMKKSVANVRWGSTNPLWKVSGSSPTLRWTHKGHVRQKHSSSPVPGLHFNPEPLNLTRLANGLSLLAQAFR